ncbi:hypothetical protein PENTCL1PPCAC_1704, partial [Pristionchus entomophagus]
EFTAAAAATLAATAAAERFKYGPAAVAAAARRDLLSRIGPAALAAGPVHSICPCGKTGKEEWPSVRWMVEIEPENKLYTTNKFLEEREAFLGHMTDIERIPAHLELLLLSEIHDSPCVITEKLAQLYCRVSNNIRMHVFQKHSEFFTWIKEVENYIIRLIATDLAKRLMTMMMKVGYAVPDDRMQMIFERIAKLEKGIGNGSTERRYRRFVAEQFGFESAFREATEFAILLNMQANVRIKEVNGESSTIPMTEEQQELLNELFDTGIFEDYERMVEVCRTAPTLERAIEMMLEDKPEERRKEPEERTTDEYDESSVPTPRRRAIFESGIFEPDESNHSEWNQLRPFI